MSKPATMTRDAQCALAARLVAERLDGGVGRWRAEGAHIIGPGTTGIGFVEHDGTEHGHVDIGFVLNRQRSDAPILWDCAAGAGDNIPERLRNAVDTWLGGTWPVIRELLSGKGEYAVHCDGQHPLGLPGWHVIRGPLMAFGAPEAARALMDWAQSAPLLAHIADALITRFDRPALNGIKLVLGPDVAEVRLNGRADERCSAALATVELPRLERFAFLRCYSLAVSPEAPSGAA